MTTLREAAEMALEALDCIYSPLHVREIDKVGKAMNALRAALAQPEQEPVAWMDREGDLYKMPEIEGWAPPHTMLYTHPPQRKPLTDDLYNELLFAVGNKYPGETRHETALRYIKQAEMSSNESSKTAHGIGGEE